MTDEHQHEIRYTVTMIDRHWWGGRVTLNFVGVSSSKEGNELLIHEQGGGLHSINYTRVWKMSAVPIEHKHEG